MRHHRIYLRNTLRTFGRDIDWDTFDVLVAHHPQLACALIDAACQLGCAAALDTELRSAAHNLADTVAAGQDMAATAPLLAAVTSAHAEINERRHTAKARFAAACRAIDESRFGVLWPRENAAPAGTTHA